jgi:hypothetical protein
MTSTIVVFPAPLGPMTPRTSPRVQGEAEPVDGGEAAEPDDDVADVEYGGGHRVVSAPAGTSSDGGALSAVVGGLPRPDRFRRHPRGIIPA